MAIRDYGQYIVTDTEAELLLLTPHIGQIGYPADTKIRLLYTGSWVPNAAVQVLRGQANVDGKSVANTTIYTMPSTSFRFVPLGAHVEVTSVSGTVGVMPTVSMGTNSPNYNNLFTGSALNSLLTTLGVTQTNALAIASTVNPITGDTALTARISVAATLFTTYSFRIDVLGYYEV